MVFKHLPRFSKPFQNPLLSHNRNTTNLPYSKLLTSKPTISQSITNTPKNPLTIFQLISRTLHTDNSSNTITATTNPNAHPSPDQVDNICKKISTLSGPEAIASSLESLQLEFSSALVEQVLRKLNNSGALALSFFQYAEQERGFQPNVDCYNALIESLGKSSQFKMVWELVNEMEKKGLLVKDTFALVTRWYARGKKVDVAIDAFHEMEKYGFKPELDDYNRLFDCLSKSKYAGVALEVFRKWKNIRFTPNVKSYTILLEGFALEQNLLCLEEVYLEMTREGFEPDVVSYGIMINAYCKSKSYARAIELYNDMESIGVKATPHVYCTLINSLGSARMLSEALKFFELAKGCGYPLDAPTYNAVVGAYCWSAKIYEAFWVVDKMRKLGLGPNTRTYDIILHHYVKLGRGKEAYSLFTKISEEEGCEPTFRTYEIMIRMFCREDMTDMAVNVWNQMKARGVLPDMYLFSVLIESLTRGNKLDDACNYFQEMLDMGIRPRYNHFRLFLMKGRMILSNENSNS